MTKALFRWLYLDNNTPQHSSSLLLKSVTVNSDRGSKARLMWPEVETKIVTLNQCWEKKRNGNKRIETIHVSRGWKISQNVFFSENFPKCVFLVVWNIYIYLSVIFHSRQPNITVKPARTLLAWQITWIHMYSECQVLEMREIKYCGCHFFYLQNAFYRGSLNQISCNCSLGLFSKQVGLYMEVKFHFRFNFRCNCAAISETKLKTNLFLVAVIFISSIEALRNRTHDIKVRNLQMSIRVFFGNKTNQFSKLVNRWLQYIFLTLMTSRST